jgi:hypothetical protein
MNETAENKGGFQISFLATSNININGDDAYVHKQKQNKQRANKQRTV